MPPPHSWPELTFLWCRRPQPQKLKSQKLQEGRALPEILLLPRYSSIPRLSLFSSVSVLLIFLPSQLQDMAGGFGAIINEAAQVYAKLEAFRSLGVCVESLELKFAETESCISILEGQLKEQRSFTLHFAREISYWSTNSGPH
ncbi:hypothetical protein Nepgr_012572 [Nepenthes gracilis]|uniref:Uncharacterized protein n=1 Tax=Nepenthes gracilis TaxID=150966 RepID=A0AAD3SH78_NEPGR|nr:hypothetical protein Nepgr_012572 [Nepenthes gracilis]